MNNQFHFRYKKQYKTKNKKQNTLCSQILQTNSWRIFAKAIVCNILWIREHLYLSLFQPVNLLKKIFWCKHFLVNFIKNTTTEFAKHLLMAYSCQWPTPVWSYYLLLFFIFLVRARFVKYFKPFRISLKNITSCICSINCKH